MREIPLAGQVLVFFVMVLCGGFCGVLFDVFRAFRRLHKSTNGVVALQDVIFWLLELTLVYMVAFKLDYAHIRAYEAIALVMGSWLYFMTLSSVVMPVLVLVISFLFGTVLSFLTPAYRFFLIGFKGIRGAFEKTKKAMQNLWQKITFKLKKA